MNRKKILIPLGIPEAGLALIKARDDIDYEIVDPAPPELLRAKLKDVHGVTLRVTGFGAADLAAAPNLMAVARLGVGYDNVDVAACTKQKVAVMIAGIANSVSVAEQAVFFMLALAKRAAEMDAMVRNDRWTERFGALPADLAGKTVLVIGGGRIGSRVIRRCATFEMNVLAYDPYLKSDVLRMYGAEPVTDLRAALPRADFVTIHCPKTAETVGLIGRAELGAMKKGAFLVNTARGGIVDEAALHAALTGGHLAGAALDVFDREPVDPANPLLKLPNTIYAPHMAGVSREALDRMAVAAVQNLLDVFDGRPKLENCVNPEVLG
jgi:D-3-phosphoglycerate dehydrogenase